MLDRIEVEWINLHKDMTKNPSDKTDPYDITISLRLFPHPLPQLQQPYSHEISMPELWVKVIFLHRKTNKTQIILPIIPLVSLNTRAASKTIR